MNYTNPLIKYAALVFIILLIVACDDDSTDTVTQSHLYSSTNDSSGNHVVSFAIKENGQLEQVDTTYTTNGVGDADDGDFDGQSSIRVIDNYLLVVNAGDHSGVERVAEGNGSVTVFAINNDGSLRFKQIVDSGGVRPVSIDYLKSDDKTFVVIANQYSNPLCFTPADPPLLNTCTDQNGIQLGDGTSGSLVPTDKRNLRAFTFANGMLTDPTVLTTYNSPDYGGPSQVSFSPDGSMLAVTTWGVPHFTTSADIGLQGPSRTYLYDVSVSDGTLSLNNERFYQQTGVSGSIGFSWSSDNEYIYVANFNIAADVPAHSVTALKTDDTSKVFKSDPSGTSEASGNAQVPGIGVEACWTWLSDDNKLLIVPSFTSNTVSTFVVGGATLNHLQNLVRLLPEESANDFPADTKDVFMTGDKKNVYVLGALVTHTVTIYDYDAETNLLVEQKDSPYEIPFSRPGGDNVSDRKHAYLGLAGWPEGYVGY
jgi:6-phosphogluconolactonase (cycloisomerase 2 family)